jgi:hypothetical protein
MISPSKLPLSCALSLIVAFGAPVALSSNALAETRLECDAEGPNDISMQAKFERRDGGRRKFSTEFEAAPGGAFTAGQRMTVFVADVKAGTARLKEVAGGDLVGDLNLDDNAGPGDDEKPFPADVPNVQIDTRVVVKIGGEKVLACRLQ